MPYLSKIASLLYARAEWLSEHGDLCKDGAIFKTWVIGIEVRQGFVEVSRKRSYGLLSHVGFDEKLRIN
jgi:hypothetical protein